MFRYALNLVLRRKLRTFLTSLGITISVVLMSFIIFGMNGLKNVLISEFTSRFAPNQIIVTGSGESFGDFAAMFGGGEATEEEEKLPIFLTSDIVEKLEKEEFINKVDPIVSLMGLSISLDGTKLKAYDGAVGGALETARNVNYIPEVFSEKDIPADNEIFVEQAVVDYFGLTKENIIGKKITLKPSISSFLTQKTASIIDKSYTFTVSGVIDTGIDRLDIVLNIDEGLDIVADLGGFSSGDAYLDAFGYSQVYIDADIDHVSEVKNKIVEEYGLNAITSEELTSFIGQITSILTIGLIMFGAISALVASIGIINTMVMSIYEQTREIGIIKAIGASNKQVMTVFLIQAGTIGFIGAVMGLGFVLLTILAIDPVIVEALKNEGFSATRFFAFDIKTCVTIIVLSIILGILAGLYPALKAARLDPVKALRYE